MRRSLTLLILALAIAPVTPLAAEEPAAERQDRYPRLSLPSVQGGDQPLEALRGEQATVFVFLSTECPISNGFVPELNRLAADYGQRGVKFVGINANAGQTAAEIAKHAEDYKLAFPVLRDAEARVARLVGVETCPTVCLFDSAGAIRYRGRIDDRYERRAGAARAPERRDLELALADLLAGREVAVSETKVVGCPLDLPAEWKPAVEPQAATVTYTRDVSRLVAQHCQECHRTGGIAPFALADYDDAVRWAEDLRDFTADRRMPPWKPVEGHGDFHNRRALSQAEIDLLARWVAEGCAEGDPADLPTPRTFAAGWTLGEPDLVLEPAEDYALAADGDDVYQCFVLPTDLPADEYVVALEVLPGNPRVVHHVIAFLDTGATATRLDAAEPGPGYRTSQGFPGFLPAGGLGGWAPGNTPHRLPEGAARVLPAGAKVVMQVHYHKTGKQETDRTRLGLYFAKTPVTRSVRALPLMPAGGPWSGFKIPAGEANYEARAALTLPDELLVYGITPHMHLLGRDLQVDAHLPDGRIEPLVLIRDWDFNWQETYQYREPLRLPRGTRLELKAHYDNSAANTRNPSRPPKAVRWGEQTTDEMCIAFLEVAPAAAADQVTAPRPTEALRFLVRSRIYGRYQAWEDWWRGQ